MEWNSIRLDGYARGMVAKTVHKNSARVTCCQSKTGPCVIIFMSDLFHIYRRSSLLLPLTDFIIVNFQ